MPELVHKKTAVMIGVRYSPDSDFYDMGLSTSAKPRSFRSAQHVNDSWLGPLPEFMFSSILSWAGLISLFFSRTPDGTISFRFLWDNRDWAGSSRFLFQNSEWHGSSPVFFHFSHRVVAIRLSQFGLILRNLTAFPRFRFTRINSFLIFSIQIEPVQPHLKTHVKIWFESAHLDFQSKIRRFRAQSRSSQSREGSTDNYA